MRAPLFSAVIALAACSGSGESSDPDAAASQVPARDTATSAVSPRVPQTAGGTRLTGQVSALGSQVSGLEVRVTDMGTVINLPADALFEFDRAELSPGASQQLSKTAQFIRAAPPGPLSVIGHTDSKGEDAYNRKLSEARARTVADWLGEQVGVRQRAFTVEGMGEAAPIAANTMPDGKDDPAGRALNRRVEVVLAKPPEG